MSNQKTLPLLVLKDIVLFPGTFSHVVINTERSRNALANANSGTYRQILLTAEKESNLSDDTEIKDIYNIGVRAKILQVLHLEDNKIKLLIESESKVKLDVVDSGQFFKASYEEIQDDVSTNIIELVDDINELLEAFTHYAQLKSLNLDGIKDFSIFKNPGYLTNVVAANVTSIHHKKQKILEELDVAKKVLLLTACIKEEIAVLEASRDFKDKVDQQVKKTQRDYFLNEQMRVIQKELGNDDKNDFTEFEKKIAEGKLSQEAKTKAEAELKRLKTMNQASAESAISRNYLDILLGMPWGVFSDSKVDVRHASGVLDQDHYGLEKVKERIIEYIAVLQRAKDLKSPILCLVGPPGVGKTSLVKSIADAVGRKYAKFSLGGVRDEAEVRGHRKTYIGSMPGKIISLIKKTGVSDPVILLDEIDKISSDFKGDPTSALLEVLDPEQNSKFNDHYLEVEYDISKVMFIATANSLNLPRPLLDRMEIIRVSGYIESEKLNIAKEYLIPKQIKTHSIKKGEFSIGDDAILDIIRYYTKESGVRNLEREIASLARKSLKKILSDKKVKSIHVTSSNLKEFLGIRKYSFESAETKDMIGVTTGLAYTEVGGDMLLIEAVTVPGKGDIKATGTLGDVMKESAQAAYSLIRSRAADFGIDPESFKDKDIHLHVPEGATPKDGPSAGIAIFTSLVSLFSGHEVKSSIAMTGEITLRGRVLPIGGLKEKLLAASRGGIKRVLIPKDNEKDLEEIPREIIDSLEIIPVSTAEEVRFQVFG
jgi:ATP-dependent Lon protease